MIEAVKTDADCESQLGLWAAMHESGGVGEGVLLCSPMPRGTKRARDRRCAVSWTLQDRSVVLDDAQAASCRLVRGDYRGVAAGFVCLKAG